MVIGIQKSTVVFRIVIFLSAMITAIGWMFAVKPVFAAEEDKNTVKFYNAPGGTVKNSDDLIAALGGSDVCSTDASGNILIKWDIELSSPIIFSEGSYTLYGAGNIIKINFVDKAAFLLEGGAKLCLGKSVNSEDDISLEIVASGKRSKASVIECVDDSVLTVNSGIKITSNDNEGDGGAIYAAGKSLTINGGIFSDNKATNGGAVALMSGELSMNGGTIFRNSAVLGGGIYINDGTSFLFVDGKIGGEYDADAIKADFTKVNNGNIAKHGGGIYIASGANFSSAGGKICSNIAEQNGGGTYFEENSVSSFYSTSIIFNTATNGGAVYTLSDTALSETSLCYNRAYDSGGGIWNSANLHLSSGSISVNSADHNGGGVFNVESGYVEIINAGIYDNVTGDFGGGMYNLGTVDFGGGYISRNECRSNDFGYGLFNLGKLNMAGIAYAGVENPITLVERDDGYTFINVVAEFNGGITMAAIETVSETQNSDGTFTYTLNGDVDLSAVKGDEELVTKAVSYLVISKYGNKDRSLNDSGNVVLEVVVEHVIMLSALICAIVVVLSIGIFVMIQYIKSKK